MGVRCASPFSQFTSSEWATTCSSAARSLRGEHRDIFRNVITTLVQLSWEECGEKADDSATGWGRRRTCRRGTRVEGDDEASG